MLGNAFSWPHALIILAVVLLLFGAAKLPALAKSVGQSAKIFKNEIKTDKADKTDKVADASPEAPAAPMYSTPSTPAAENPPRP